MQLGMEFTEQFSWPKSLENTLSANKAASYLIAKSRFSSAFPLTIYDHLLCYPLLNLVALSGASNPLTKFLFEIQNNVMRSFLGAGRNAPIATLLRDIISCSPLPPTSCPFYFYAQKHQIRIVPELCTN